MKNKIILAVMVVVGAVMEGTLGINGSVCADSGPSTNIINCPADGNCICHVLDLIVEIMSIGIGILGVIGIVISGIQYMTAGGNEEKTRKSKRRLLELVIGLALFAALATVVSWLNPGGLFCGGSGSGGSGGSSQNGSGGASGTGQDDNGGGQGSSENGETNNANNNSVSDYAKDAVDWVTKEGIMTGNGTSFNPKGQLRRQDAITALWRMEGEVKVDNGEASNEFSDISADGSREYYSDALDWAVQKGIIIGNGSGKFNGGNSTTRGDFVLMLWRLAGKPTSTTKAKFTDVSNSALDWAVEKGVVTDGSTFGASRKISREEAATMIYRYKK